MTDPTNPNASTTLPASSAENPTGTGQMQQGNSDGSNNQGDDAAQTGTGDNIDMTRAVGDNPTASNVGQAV